jgi:hypothetical protein
MHRGALPWLCGAVALTAALFSPAASAASIQTCKGTAEHPGVLTGSYAGDVRVEGVCTVPAGPAEVHGTLTLRPGSAVIATFGMNNTHLTVDGNIRVQRGATLLLGCGPQDSPCADDPNPSSPTLTSVGMVRASIVSEAALGVVVHDSQIGGNVVQRGGGGGFRCDSLGIFKKVHSPTYSAYEDSTIAGSVSISDVHSCWLGITRTSVGKSVRLLDNHFPDPDAIEVISNHIGDDLACFGNTPHLWDSSEHFGQMGLYPRTPGPNTVEGKRLGQCELASPPTDSSPPGPGPF